MVKLEGYFKIHIDYTAFCLRSGKSLVHSTDQMAYIGDGLTVGLPSFLAKKALLK